MSPALSTSPFYLQVASSLLPFPSSHPNHFLLSPSHSQILNLPLPPMVGSQLPAIRHSLLLPCCCVWVLSEPGHLAPNLFLLGISKYSPLIFSYAFAGFLRLPASPTYSFKALCVSEALINSSEQNTRMAPPGLEVTSHTSQEMAHPTKSHPPPKHRVKVTRYY